MGGLLAKVENSPDFVVDAMLSAADGEILRQNLLALDGASYLAAPAFEWRLGQSLTEFGRNPQPFWAGGFRYLSGMTTHYIYVGNSGLTTGDKLRIVYTGDTVTSSTDVTLTAGNQTITRTISGLGFAHGEVVRVDLLLYNASKPSTGASWGATILQEMVVTPVQIADSWPGVPTFGQITEANLDQLSNAVNWLIRTMGLHHRPLFAAVVRELGPYGPRASGKAGQANVRWNGSVRRTNEHAKLVVDATLLVLDPQYTEKVELFVDGVLRATYNVPGAAGEYDFQLTYTIATAVDGISQVELLYTRTSTEAASGVVYNRLSIWRVAMDRATEPTAASIAAMPERTTGNYTALQTWLNGLCTRVSAIKTRLDANVDVWGRQRLFKRRNAIDNDQLVFYAPARISWSPGRIGDALIVRGKAIKIGYGPLVLPNKPDSTNDGIPRWYTTKYVREEDVASADTIRTVVHYLDSFGGLTPGAAFAILGVECYYAAEQLLDVDGGL